MWGAASVVLVSLDFKAHFLYFNTTQQEWTLRTLDPVQSEIRHDRKLGAASDFLFDNFPFLVVSGGSSTNKTSIQIFSLKSTRPHKPISTSNLPAFNARRMGVEEVL